MVCKCKKESSMYIIHKAIEKHEVSYYSLAKYCTFQISTWFVDLSKRIFPSSSIG